MNEEELTLEQGTELYAASMRRRFGWFFYLSGMAFLLRGIRFKEHSAEIVRRASSEGPLVYAMYEVNRLDYLALNVALNARKLPLAQFANGIRTRAWMPIREYFRTVLARIQGIGKGNIPDPVKSGWLTRLISSGANSLVFLIDQPSWWERVFKKTKLDPLSALLKAQEKSEKPIQVVPVVVIWDRAPKTRSEGRSFVNEREGFWERAYALLKNRGKAVVQVGEPLNLETFIDRYVEESSRRKARILRVALRRYLYREQSLIIGPRIRSHGAMRRFVLNSAPIKELIVSEARSTGYSEEKVRNKVERTFDKIAARLSFPYISTTYGFTRFLWNRIYSGVDIRPSDMEKVRQAQRRGAVILVPCHRSHLDYVLISSIWYQHDLAIPHIVAGINLSFWPAGYILRRLGAVFVKRSFKGDRIFATVFNRYIQQLIREGHAVEFFIEGGRSRTGKLLPPKLGVLNTIVSTGYKLIREDFDVTILPINISYEKVAEEGAYAREISGEQKQKESLGQVIKARKILKHRYGRVYLRIGEQIRLSEVFQKSNWEQLNEDKRRDEVQHLGEKILHQINQEAMVLPTALLASALLTNTRRGIREKALLERVDRFEAFLSNVGIQPGVSMRWKSWAMETTLKTFTSDKKIIKFEDDEGTVYRVAEEARLSLEFYKNSLLHCFAPASILSLLIKSKIKKSENGLFEKVELEIEPLRDQFAALSHLLRFELVYDPDITFEELFEKALLQLKDYGALSNSTGSIDILRFELILELSSLIENLIESYCLVLKVSYNLREQDLGSKKLPVAILKAGQGMYAVEEILRKEALSAVNIQNAIKVFIEDGVYEPKVGGGLNFNQDLLKKTKDLLWSVKN